MNTDLTFICDVFLSGSHRLLWLFRYIPLLFYNCYVGLGSPEPWSMCVISSDAVLFKWCSALFNQGVRNQGICVLGFFGGLFSLFTPPPSVMNQHKLWVIDSYKTRTSSDSRRLLVSAGLRTRETVYWHDACQHGETECCKTKHKFPNMKQEKRMINKINPKTS